MLITGIRSKPVYKPLEPDAGGRHHLLLGHGVGGEQICGLISALEANPATRALPRRVLYVSDASATPETIAKVKAAKVTDLQTFPDTSALLTVFREVLSASVMGTRLYVAGPETFIGLVMRIAAEFNLNNDEIRAEECGSAARRVHCIHCRSAMENVKTNIVTCTGCGRSLIVRDHYSRRLAAYMGVMVDAEAPGEVPPIQEIFV